MIGRASDRHAQLDSELKGLQMSLRELESFLKWLQEAETTVNVLADASQREDLSQDSAHVKELRRQLEVGLQRYCVCGIYAGASLLSQGHHSLTHSFTNRTEGRGVCGCIRVSAAGLKCVNERAYRRACECLYALSAAH